METVKKEWKEWKAIFTTVKKKKSRIYGKCGLHFEKQKSLFRVRCSCYMWRCSKNSSRCYFRHNYRNKEHCWEVASTWDIKMCSFASKTSNEKLSTNMRRCWVLCTNWTKMLSFSRQRMTERVKKQIEKPFTKCSVKTLQLSQWENIRCRGGGGTSWYSTSSVLQ